jgi:oligopeptide transport system substrate-binding protein
MRQGLLKPLSGAIAVAFIATAVAAGGSSTGAPAGSNAPIKTAKPAVAVHNGMKTLRWDGLEGTPTWANTLDPAMVTDSISYNIIGMVNAGLVKLLPNGTPGDDLASSIKVSKNKQVYTFHMRSGLKFSNGDAVTASDVAWSLKRALAPKTHSPVGLAYLGHILGAAKYAAGKASSMRGIKVLNNLTIQLKLDSPIAFFLKTLTYPTADVLDPKVVKGHPSQTYITNNCAANVGAGQFMFKCRGKTGLNSFYPSGATPAMTLVPNPKYWGKKPRINVYMPAIADVQTAYKLFEQGGIDSTPIPSVDIKANKGKPGFSEFPTSAVDYITPNEQAAPFNNVHCRLAIADAINRSQISAVLHYAQAPAYAVVPKGMLGWYKGTNSPHYDTTKARQELAQCPGHLSSGITIPFQKTSTDLENEYAVIQGDLQAIGVNATVQGLDFNAWLNIVGQSLQKTHTSIVENLWIEDYPDPYDYCTLLLRGGQNYDIGGFNNSKYNSLVDRAAVTQNVGKRASLYIQAQRIALGQAAWIAVTNVKGFTLTNPKVHGLIGAEAFGILVPKGNDWSNVSIG